MTYTVQGLNHAALWEKAKQQAKYRAELLFPPHMTEERAKIEREMTVRYYRQMTTPG